MPDPARPACVRCALVAAVVLTSAGLTACRTGAGGDDELAQAAARFHDPIARSALRERALERLEQFGHDPDPTLRAHAIEALVAAPARLEPIVAVALRDEVPAVRTVAAMAVGRAQLARLTHAVRPLLQDHSPFVRAAAIYALRRLGADVDPTPLASILLTDPSPQVRAHVAYILGELGEPSAIGLLRQAARDPMPRAPVAQVRLLQLQIAEAMVKLGDDSQVQTIRAALYPARPDELEATALAVQIIGHVQDHGATDQLIYLSAYRNEFGQPMPAEVRLGVAESLARLGLRRGSFIADEYADSELPLVRAQAAMVYGQIGGAEALARLERMLEDPSAQVQVAASAGVLQALQDAYGGLSRRTRRPVQPDWQGPIEPVSPRSRKGAVLTEAGRLRYDTGPVGPGAGRAVTAAGGVGR